MTGEQVRYNKDNVSDLRNYIKVARVVSLGFLIYAEYIHGTYAKSPISSLKIYFGQSFMKYKLLHQSQFLPRSWRLS